MLGVGIDWAEEAHEVALGRPGQGVIETATVAHTPAAVDALIARIAQLEPDPAEVRVVLETRHGLLAERLVVAGDDLAAPTFLKLLQRWPTPDQLRTTSRHEIATFARSCHHGWPDRFADKVATALAADHFQAPPALLRAKADTIRLHATQLLTIGQQRRAWEKRMGQLLIGPPTGGELSGQVFPDGEIYLSMPGLGVRLAARVAGEIGDHPYQFNSPNAVQAYGGKAPVTRRSGKSQLVLATRLACNRYLDHAVQDWAFCSLRWSSWARDYYDTLPARGKTHHAALRALGNRWLNILWHRLHRRVLYDEALHQTNRLRAQQRPAA